MNKLSEFAQKRLDAITDKYKEIDNINNGKKQKYRYCKRCRKQTNTNSKYEYCTSCRKILKTKEKHENINRASQKICTICNRFYTKISGKNSTCPTCKLELKDAEE